MSFTISDAKVLAESWFDDTLDATLVLAWGNEFIRRIVSNRLWLDTTKAYAATVIPSADPTVSASGTGTLTGVYLAKVTFVDADGAESSPNAGIVTVTAASDAQIDWSAIPTRTGCTRKLYRTKANGSVYYYVATIADATTTTYTDTTADTSLTVPMNIKTRYNLPTTFFRSVLVEDVNGDEYANYLIANRKMQFGSNGDYVLTYVPYPTALTAISGTGQEVSLPDALVYPMAEFLAFKHYNLVIKDETSKAIANEYEQRFRLSLKNIYDEMEINSETESFQVKLRW